MVVGAGAAGLAAARMLARQGRPPVVLEQFAIGTDRGSSHGSSRVFRLSYPDAQYVRMAQRSLPLWRELEEEAGEALLVTTGALDVGPGFHANRAALASCGAAASVIDGAEASRRYGLHLPADAPVLVQPDGGYLHADRVLGALAVGAVSRGAELVEGTRVRAIADEGRTVRVTTDEGELAASAVVVAAGAWGQSLLGTAGIPLAVVPTRETVAYVALPETRFPPFIDSTLPPPDYGVRRAGQLTYALPAPGVGVKAGLHHSGPPADPDLPGIPDDEVARWATDFVAQRVPGTVPQPIRAETCLYANTADESFVLERHGRIVVASACSGHGFKFTPLVGQIVGALALEAAG